MDYYNNLVSKIIDVITKSEDKKRTLPVSELKNNYNKYFINRLGRDIYFEYIQELDDLLELENTCYSLMNADSKFDKNREIYKIAMQNQDNYLYNELLQILKNIGNKYYDQLTMYLGYFICKSDKDRFIQLLKELQLGPFKSVTKFDKTELLQIINNNVNLKNEQEKRISNYMVSRILDNTQNERYAQTRKNMSTLKYSNIISLGINNSLDTNTIIKFGSALDNIELNELIHELEVFQIFDDEQLYMIKSEIENRSIEDIKIDELVRYFAMKENLNFEVLKALIPYIGEYNYNYIIKSLKEYGIESQEEKSKI